MFRSGVLSFFMTASSASISNDLIQTSADEYYRAPSPTTPMSPALVNDAADHTERPSLKLRFPRGASNILNSAVIDVAGQSLYYISSTSKYTIMISCKDNVEVAIVNWNRHSPQMAFRRRKMKCKNWLKLTDPANGNGSRTLTHDNAQFTWIKGKRSTSGHLIPANTPGQAIARWQIKPGGDELILEIFQETPIESGFLDSIVLSVVLLRSGYALGDGHEYLYSYNPTPNDFDSAKVSLIGN